MGTSFPSGIDTVASLGGDTSNDATPTATVHASAHDNLADALNAVETALGTNPSGSFATVAAAIAAMFVKSPSTAQTISPTADVVSVTIKQGSNTYTSNLLEWHDSTNAILGFIDHLGVLSAQGLKINGTALSSLHLSDVGLIQKKGKVAANVATGSESLVAAMDIIQGVSPGRVSGATPQTALQVTANNTWNLTVTKGAAIIQGTDDVAQGMYGAVQNANATLALTTQAPAVNPRIDAIVVQYNDSEYTARTPADNFVFTQVVGTPTSGANLTNLAGAPAIPASAVLLAYILVNTTDVGVQAANVSDQRILTGPAVWGEDNHRYRLAVDSAGNLFLGQVS